jgi:hypothetical protein
MKEIIHIRSSHSVVSEEEEAVLGLETPQKVKHKITYNISYTFHSI